MPLNCNLLGRTLPAGEQYEVSLAKVREFAVALGDDNPLYRDPVAARRAGYPHVIAPPTFAVVVSAAEWAAVLRHPELGLCYERILHAEQAFAHARPIVVGDVLTTTCTITEIGVRGPHELLAWRAEIVDADRALVCSVQASAVSRDTAP